jgi:transcription elongation factor Elf1
MTQKIYITSKQMATFSCPQCNRSKTVDVSKYAAIDKMVTVNIKCPCGHAYKAILEKRRQYRKETNLPGTYVHFIDGQPRNRGLMTVKDLSTAGMKLRLNVKQSFAIGDQMRVEFHLDDAHRTLIKKTVIIRNQRDQFIGVELAPFEAVDKALGFYLFS